jgi:hypothetical protein
LITLVTVAALETSVKRAAEKKPAASVETMSVFPSSPSSQDANSEEGKVNTILKNFELIKLSKSSEINPTTIAEAIPATSTVKNNSTLPPTERFR